MKNRDDNLISTLQTSSPSFSELAAYYSDWDAEYRQLSPGRFKGSLHLAHTPSFSLINDIWNQAILVHGTIPKGIRIISAITHHTTQRFRSRTIENGELITATGGSEVDYQTHGPCDALSFAIPEHLFDNYLQRTGRIASWNDTDPHIIAKSSAKKAIQTGLRWKRCLSKLNEAQQLSAPNQQAIIDWALGELLDSITDESGQQAPQRSSRKRLATAHEAKTYLEKHCDGPVTLLELCTALNVNERTLLLGFNELMGCSPGAYQRAYRYNMARRDLTNPAPNTSVTSVATFWGFYHLGRFSTGYRKHFGESPRETLFRSK